MTLLRYLMCAISCASLGLPALATAAAPAAVDQADKADKADRIDISSDDINEASAAFSTPRRYHLDRLNERLPDGVKGIIYQPHVEPPLQMDGIKDAYLAPLHRYGCTAEVFGLAQLVGKKSFAGRDGAGVFTKLRFKLIDDWRPGGGAASRTVDITLPGGELTHNGEPVRFENFIANYQLNARYVLMAGDKRAQNGKSVMGQPPYLEVADGVIFPGPGWTPFKRGTSLAQAKADVAKAVALKECAQ